MATKKKVTQSKTMWFNGLLGLVSGLVAALPSIVQSLASPEAADALKQILPESVSGILLAIAIVGNAYLRTITTQPLGKSE